ncbi:hypothetical protein M407DRAFT_244259 [Tulasnella calospora MUT 4182]|uniref:Proteasome maturation factor UMP1 n=1 Tax=Tulasnella calospora MUT 4182 TaxID=1051891 RepID=A0A0C3LUA1_9AGAM|nr:hypothetical protein M407DRAFT_244259 [Tulasnella calospora MUT 4182]
MDSTSYRLIPVAHDDNTSKASVKDTANSLGTHDTLRYGQRSLADDISTGNGLQRRLDNWEETQDNLKLNMQRNLYGLHAPVRLMMERKLVGYNPHFPTLKQSNIHLDILMGRDETLDATDLFADPIMGPEFQIHSDMEKKRRI